jgi:hypothetical protein
LAPASTWASYSGVLFSVPASTVATILAAVGISGQEKIARIRRLCDAISRGEVEAPVELGQHEDDEARRALRG